MFMKVPEDADVHVIDNGDGVAYTIKCDNFDKLIGIKTPTKEWVHKDYRKRSKKQKKRKNRK